MAEDILKKKVPVLDVALLILYSLPVVVATASPFATLVGFLMGIGRMVSENEVLILRALGVSFKTILLPVLVVGLFISVVSLFVNDFLLPLGNIEFSKLYRSILTSNPALELESYAIKRNDSSILITGEVKGTEVSNLLFLDTDADGNNRFIFADTSQILDPKKPEVLMQLIMSDPLIVSFVKNKPDNFDYIITEKAIMNVLTSSFGFALSSGTNPREMTAYDLKKEIIRMKSEENPSPSQINSYELEYYKKFAIPFGSIFFAFLAFPLGIIFGKHNGQSVGVIIGIAISVIYWALLIGGQTFGLRNGFSGFLSMWLPNMIIAAAAVIFYLHLLRK